MLLLEDLLLLLLLLLLAYLSMIVDVGKGCNSVVLSEDAGVCGG